MPIRSNPALDKPAPRYTNRLTVDARDAYDRWRRTRRDPPRPHLHQCRLSLCHIARADTDMSPPVRVDVKEFVAVH